MRIGSREIFNFYHSFNICSVIKSRRLSWVGHVTGMEEGISAFKILTGKEDLEKGLQLDETKILGWILEKWWHFEKLRIEIIEELL